ncbi:MAG: hypothetical protein LC130_23145 [Bryobacterales bacterium]|nr:hypothetical protein [Bryobacterales bacterium]
MIGIVLANFVWTIVTTIRAGRVQKKTQQDIAQTKQAVTTVKEDIPAQVQSQIKAPLNEFQSQIEKSLADVAGVGSVMSQSLRDQGANYADLVRGYQEQLALVQTQLNRAMDQIGQRDKQLFDLRVFIDDLQKGRRDDFEKIRALELKQRQMDEIQQAQAEGSKARDKRIKELQDRNDESQRETTRLRAELADYVKQLEIMRTQNAELRTELDRLRGIEGKRQLLLQTVATLKSESARDQQRITELETEVARLKSNSAHVEELPPHGGN